MVTRKYLCSAPHPSTWDEKAIALLKSLGGNRKKREKVIQQTLAALEQVIEVERKSGPGRKSNAEHALNFYEYVMELVDEDDESSETDGKAKSSSRSRREGSERLANKKTDDDQDNSSSSSSDGVSMNSQEFLDEHNDECEICNNPGDLICCATCNLVFHLNCTRPKLTKLPPDHWSCSFCVSSGVTGHKRDSRTRKRAMAAVRVLNRLKEEVENGGKMEDIMEDDEEEEDEEEDTKDDEESKARAVNKSDNDEEDEGQKPSPAKTQPSPAKAPDDAKEKEESVTSSPPKAQDTDKPPPAAAVAAPAAEEKPLSPLKLEAQTERRARRARQKPILYNPQDCPASEWQSDGVFEWKVLSQSETGIPDTADGTEEDEKQPDKKKKSDDGASTSDNDEPIWCNFCNDDPSVPVCVFCACRICFGKHDVEKLLLCDRCDDEYHTYCLNPPLNNVPNSKKWFCKGCKVAMKKEKSDSAVTRGKSVSPSKKSAVTVSGRGSGKKASTATPDIVKKRGPGRPPSSGRTGRSTPEVKRRVGRPPLSEKQSGEKRPRGRPPLNQKSGRGSAKASQEPQKRPRGRPPLKKHFGGRGISVSRPGGNGPGRPGRVGRPSKKTVAKTDSSDKRGRPAKRPRSPGHEKGMKGSPRTGGRPATDEDNVTGDAGADEADTLGFVTKWTDFILVQCYFRKNMFDFMHTAFKQLCHQSFQNPCFLTMEKEDINYRTCASPWRFGATTKT